MQMQQSDWMNCTLLAISVQWLGVGNKFAMLLVSSKF